MEGEVAVNVNVISIPTLMNKLDVEPGAYAKAMEIGVGVETTLSAIKVSCPGGSPQWMIPVKMASLQEVANGTASEVLTFGLKNSLTEVLLKAIKAVAGEKDGGQMEVQFEVGGKKVAGPASGSTQDAMKQAPAYVETSMPEKGKWGMMTPAEAKTMKPVSLVLADKMYQPVIGTSSPEPYYVVALRDDLKVAARLKGGSLSVRIEGTGFSKYTALLKDAELQVHGMSHASLHLDTKGAKMAARALGAVLCSLNINFDTPAPVLKNIGGS